MTKQQIINQMQERLDAHSREIGRLQVQRDALLEALKNMVHFDDLKESEQAPAMAQARAAIAKACGQAEGKE